MIWLLMSSAWTVGVTLGSAGHAAPTLGVVVARAGDLLLRPGRRLGRLAGQATHGLARDVRGTKNRWWLRVGLRTAVFQVPSVIYFMGATRGPTSGGRVHGAVAAVDHSAVLDRPPWQRLDRRPRAAEPYRVVQRNVRPVASAAPKAPPADLVPALSSLRRVGPYAVHTMVGETGGGRLFVGIDPILRRHVWIHEVPPGTPPVEAARRDLSRPGRLYWLAGRRSATENWDAFEAPRGEPFLTAPPTSDWRQVHRALSSLATELEASARDRHGYTAHSRPHVEASGRTARASRLLVAGLNAPEAHQTRSAVELLAAVSTRALDPTPSLPRRCRAQHCCIDLRAGAPPALADVKAELLRLASMPDRPSRVRRALPMVMAAMPLAALLLIVSVMLPMVARSIQGDASNIIRQRSEFHDVDDVDH